MKHMTEKDNILLKRIANHLIIHASFMSDLGLYHGKMGVVLFFAHYGRYTNNSLYDDFSGELLKEICADLHIGLPIDFENGLCGIGWSIEYLVQNEFLEGDSDEILYEIDQRIMEYDLKRLKDRSLETGLKGILTYIQKRLLSKPLNEERTIFDKQYLSDFNLVKRNEYLPTNEQIIKSVIKDIMLKDDLIFSKLGLDNGCAGMGLKMIWK